MKKIIGIVLCMTCLEIFVGCRMKKADAVDVSESPAEMYGTPDAIAENMEIQDEPVWGEEEVGENGRLLYAGTIECAECGIEMSVTQSSYPVNVQLIEYRVNNQRETPVSLGEDFIEYLGEEGWERIPFQNRARPDILYIVPSGRMETFSFLLQPSSYEYLPGKYRIFQHFYDVEDGTDYTQIVEFMLKSGKNNE